MITLLRCIFIVTLPQKPAAGPAIAVTQAVQGAIATWLHLSGSAMNRSILRSTVIALSTVLGFGAASAADLAVKATPYVAPAPIFSWTGCYVGAHAGAGVLHDQ